MNAGSMCRRSAARSARCVKLRRDDQRAEALGAVAQVERAVLDAIDARQRRVQRLERSALAGDLHQAGFATVQREAALVARPQLVRDALRREDMAALHREFSRALGQAHAGAELPRLVERSAARRDHAGLARAVDLEHRGVPAAARRPAPGERRAAWSSSARRRGPAAAGERRRRRAGAAAKSSASAAREVSASAAPRSAGSSGRPECIARPFCHGSITVASRPNMCCGGTVPTMVPLGADARGERARPGDQRAPGFRVRHRPAGAARGEDDRGDVGGIDRAWVLAEKLVPVWHLGIRQRIASRPSQESRTACGARLGGSSVVCPAISAAANATVNA